MSPRNTRTGTVLENMVLPALEMGGYNYRTQVVIGTRPGGRRHKVDLVVDKAGKVFLVSLKWQQVGGTAEEKVPFEVICLMEAVRSSQSSYWKAYVVLGGAGWTLRDFYVKGGLEDYLKCGEFVEIKTLEQFIAIANQGRL
jgi:hypothetical protein